MYVSTHKIAFKQLYDFFVISGGGGSDAISRDGSSDGDDTPDPITYSVSLSLVNADGQTDGQLSASNPLTLTARVTDNTGAIATDQLVTFTFNPEGLAEFGKIGRASCRERV